MVADYKRILFTKPSVGSGWVGARGGAFNVLIDGVDSTNIDDDAYFFYNAHTADLAVNILKNQGLLSEANGATITISDVPSFTFGGPTATNTRWLILVNGAFCLGIRGGAFNLGNDFSQCVFFHSEHDYQLALDILRKQDILKTTDTILTIPLSLTT